MHVKFLCVILKWDLHFSFMQQRSRSNAGKQSIGRIPPNKAVPSCRPVGRGVYRFQSPPRPRSLFRNRYYRYDCELSSLSFVPEIHADEISSIIPRLESEHNGFVYSASFSGRCISFSSAGPVRPADSEKHCAACHRRLSSSIYAQILRVHLHLNWFSVMQHQLSWITWLILGLELSRRCLQRKKTSKRVKWPMGSVTSFHRSFPPIFLYPSMGVILMHRPSGRRDASTNDGPRWPGPVLLSSKACGRWMPERLGMKCG
ncbi:hypothetical protein QBC45DRAFT_181393 [Copromyces sp. CBS 386.78]|nr:hypothetical protein QBC45DRAFT_181393 [Copromyces sp. CBS 386.78]